ncbi:hypothetical protein JCM8097_005470, partial [Rhodosporidiobolus ruineniae]
YSDELLEVEELRAQAKRQHCCPDPLAAWDLVDEYSEGENPLSRLARHLLAIVPNTGANERVFSSWGLIHTKTRNRLGHELFLSSSSRAAANAYNTLVEADDLIDEDGLEGMFRAWFATLDQEEEDAYLEDDGVVGAPPKLSLAEVFEAKSG